MNFVDKQNIAGLEVGQQRGKVSSLFQHWPRGGFEVHLHLIGNNMRESSLA